MNILTLITIVVLSAMPTGYRRAGFALEQGENSLEVNQVQYDLLSADKNLKVVAESENEQQNNSTITYTREMFAKLLDENAKLKSQVTALTTLGTGQEESIEALERELASHIVTHEDTLGDLVGVDDTTFDCSSAPIELHHFIAIIDDLNKQAPLTKKPNCDHLTITVDDEPLTPTAAQRDAAWAWYQENVVIATADANQAEAEA